MTKKELLEEIVSRNASIDQNKASRIINEKFMALFSPSVLEYCANYEIVQDKLLSLTQTQLNIISRIIKMAEYHNQDWTIPAADFITFVENTRYHKLQQSIEGKLLTEIEIQALMFLTRNSFNYFSITDYKELSEISTIRKNKERNNLENESPEIILLNKYGISYNTAKHYLERYGKDLNLLPESQEKEFLKDICSIIKGKGTSTLIYEDINFINNLNSRLSNLFVGMYNDKLFQLTEKQFIQNYHTEDGTMIPIYDAGTEFMISLHSVGLANHNKPENYYESWHRNDARNDKFCNSIVTSRSMNVIQTNCIYGFSKYENNDLKLVSANDLGTGALERDPIASKLDHEKRLIAKVEYRAPEQMDNFTRITNNEIYRARRRMANGRLEKVNPDYLVYFMNGEDYHSDPVWQETIKASLDYKESTGTALPIVRIDCEKCLAYNVKLLKEKVYSLLSNFDDKELLIEIIELMHTLRMGYNKNQELLNKYLNKEVLLETLNNILGMICSMSDFVPRLALEHLDNLEQTLNKEYEKMNASPYWIEQSTGQKEIPKDVSIYRKIEETKMLVLSKLKVNQEITDIKKM